MSAQSLPGETFACPITEEMDWPRESVQLLVDTALMAQDNEAVEELGDTIRSGEEFSLECSATAGVDGEIEEWEVSSMMRAVNRCLQQRYLGLCTTSTCEGRQAMDERIERLGLKNR